MAQALDQMVRRFPDRRTLILVNPRIVSARVVFLPMHQPHFTAGRFNHARQRHTIDAGILAAGQDIGATKVTDL